MLGLIAKNYTKDTKNIVNADVMSTSTVVGHASRQHQGSHLGDGCNHRNVAAGCASGEFQIFPSLLSS